MKTQQELLAYWLDDVGPSGWYKQDDALDADIAKRFGGMLDHAAEGGYGLWLTSASGVLAYIILTDQFPRNMFRGDGRSFATDANARAAAKAAIAHDWDMRIFEPARQFFYLPLMHSENLTDQDRCVRLIHSRMPETGADTLVHARAHRSVIRQFGRFPYRNDALGRVTTAAEQKFLESGGYSTALRAERERDAA